MSDYELLAALGIAPALRGWVREADRTIRANNTCR